MNNIIRFKSDPYSEFEFFKVAERLNVKLAIDSKVNTHNLISRVGNGISETLLSSMVQVLAATGGVAGLAKVIIAYLNLKHQKRSVKVVYPDGRSVEVEGASEAEVKKLLSNAAGLIVKTELLDQKGEE